MSFASWVQVTIFSGLMGVLYFWFVLVCANIGGWRGRYVVYTAIVSGIAVYALLIVVATLDPAATEASVQEYLNPSRECITLNGKRYCEVRP